MNMNPRKAIVGPTTIRPGREYVGVKCLRGAAASEHKQKTDEYRKPGYRHQYKVDFGQGEAAARLCLNYVPGIFVGTCIIVWCHICV